MPFVRIEKPRPHTSVIVLDRPARMNSMAFEVMVPLHEACAEVAEDHDTGVVILTGTGRGFCSGADTEGGEPPPNIEGLTLTRIATPVPPTTLIAVGSGGASFLRRCPERL